MVEEGFDPQLAESVIEKLRADHVDALRDAAHRNMVPGGIWFTWGITVTVLSFPFAESLGGGKYTIWVGAILVGWFQFLRGVGQLREARSADHGP
jgi:hypothetical protein